MGYTNSHRDVTGYGQPIDVVIQRWTFSRHQFAEGDIEWDCQGTIFQGRIEGMGIVR